MRVALNRSPLPPLLTLLALGGVMLWRMGWPILILVGPFAVAYALWFRYGWRRPAVPSLRLGQYLALLEAAQILHFAEEYLTRFQVAFPALWGDFWQGDPARYAAWNSDFFVSGNLLMDALWLLALTLLPRRNAWASYMLWLFVSGMLVNVLGHPLYALYTGFHPELRPFVPAAGLLGGWYFPGLLTVWLHALLLPGLLREWRRCLQPLH